MQEHLGVSQYTSALSQLRCSIFPGILGVAGRKAWPQISLFWPKISQDAPSTVLMPHFGHGKASTRSLPPRQIGFL